ncbi:Cysteine-rich repeat secretory protein like, partial [Actinidia chinensis var. chinensis]
MDNIPSSKTCFLLILPLILCFGNINLSAVSTNSESDHHNLVYRHCPNQNSSTDPQLLSSLFQQLVGQSSKSKFYETSAGDEQVAISGLFQCRNDLSNYECHNCVTRLPEKSKSFCGTNAPVRVHLSGCYMRYKVEGFQTSRLELQHKTCSESKAVLGGFKKVRDGAFGSVESGVVDGDGFCVLSYESMHVMAQCEGNLRGCECGECVNKAVHIAQDECGASLSGEVYLDSCFMSYSYYERGIIPTNSKQDYGRGIHASGKLIAIVVGGAAALVFAFIFLYFCRSFRKKSD